MIEPEIAFADLEDDMILAENMLKYVIRYVMENAPEEMNFFNSFVDKGLIDRLNNVVNSDFARVTYTQKQSKSLKSTMTNLNTKYHGEQICRQSMNVI